MTLLALTSLGPLKLPILRLILLIALLYEGLAHVRYMSIFGLLVPMLIATPFQQQYARFTATLANTRSVQNSPLDKLFNLLIPAARRSTTLIAITLLIGAGYVLCLWIQPVPPAKYAPVAALASARQAGLESAPVFNDYPFGGFLIAQGIPVFIDGRADMYGTQYLQTYFDAISPNHLQKFGAFLDDHHIEWTLLPPDNYLVEHLSTLPGWQQIHHDEYGVVHRRTHP